MGIRREKQVIISIGSCIPDNYHVLHGLPHSCFLFLRALGIFSYGLRITVQVQPLSSVFGHMLRWFR